MKLVNGIEVTSVRRVPWEPLDDAYVQLAAESRGVVETKGGGLSNAVVIGGRAVIWERTPNGVATPHGRGAFTSYLPEVVTDIERPRAQVQARPSHLLDPSVAFRIYGEKNENTEHTMWLTLDVRQGVDGHIRFGMRSDELMRMLSSLSAMVLWRAA